MSKNKNGDSKIVAHARRELELAGLFTKDPKEDYDGSLGRGALAIIKVFDSWAAGNGPKMQALSQLFHSLISGEIISPPTTDPDEWEKIERDDVAAYRNKRNPFYVSNDIKFRTWANIATQETGASKNHITGEVPEYEKPEQSAGEKSTVSDEGQASDDGSNKPSKEKEENQPSTEPRAENKKDEGSNKNSSGETRLRVDPGVAEKGSTDSESTKSPAPKPKGGKKK